MHLMLTLIMRAEKGHAPATSSSGECSRGKGHGGGEEITCSEFLRDSVRWFAWNRESIWDESS